MSLNRLRLSLLLAVLLTGAGAAFAATAAPDPRQAFRAGTSPDWLRAVGRLVVPGIRFEDGRRRHHIERCSATLVRGRNATRADTIVTAWHCLEYYEDLSQRILFQVINADDAPVEIVARRLADGGDMTADWAVLRLERPITLREAPALAVATTTGPDTLLMAGYSRDAGIGMDGRQLTYDPQCEVTQQQRGYTDSNCRAFKGASGGAVIQLSDTGTPLLTGVISQGDGDQLSRYIPVGIFRRTLLRYL